MSYKSNQPSGDPYDRTSEPPRPQKPIHPLEQPPPPPASVAPPDRPPKLRVEMPGTTPVLSYLILGVNVVVFLADYLLLGRGLTLAGAKDNLAIIDGEYWRLVTPIFLHGGILHLGLNSYFLYLIGPQIERHFGYYRFLAIYLLSGIAGTVTSFAFSQYRSIGASGALFGLVGAMIPFLYHNRTLISNTRSRISNIILVIVVNLLIGLSPGIDNWGHVGGLAGGLVLAWFATPRYVLRDRLGDVVRIDDRSSPLVAWLAIILFAIVLAGVTLLLIAIRGGTIPISL
jgi:rhomboid protease GluP